jgi:putative endonuclease
VVTSWHVYVLVSADGGRTYVGVTSDLPRRLAQHNGEQPGGAKSTRAGRPWSVGATFGPYPSRGRAQAVEHRVKRRAGRDRLRPLPFDDLPTPGGAGEPALELPPDPARPTVV